MRLSSPSADELRAVGRVLAGLSPEERAGLAGTTIGGHEVDLHAAEAIYRVQPKSETKDPAAKPGTSETSKHWAAPLLSALTEALVGGTSAYCGHDSPIELRLRSGELIGGTVPVVHQGWARVLGAINVGLDLSTYWPIFGLLTRPVAAALAGVLAGAAKTVGAADQADSLKRTAKRQARLSLLSMGGSLSDATVTPLVLIDSNRDLAKISKPLGPLSIAAITAPKTAEAAPPGFERVERQLNLLRLGREMAKAADAFDGDLSQFKPTRT